MAAPSFQLYASGSTDADGTIVKYDWDMDNDGTFEIIDGEQAYAGALLVARF